MTYARILPGLLGDPRVIVGSAQRTYFLVPAVGDRYSARQLLEYFGIGEHGGSVIRDSDWTYIVIRTA